MSSKRLAGTIATLPSPPLQKKIIIIICEKDILQFYDLLLNMFLNYVKKVTFDINKPRTSQGLYYLKDLLQNYRFSSSELTY